VYVRRGYNSQKALDAELRARIDALALTIHPMIAMDASRMPRGSKPEIRPGKIILTNGNPAEVLQPFNFGNVNQITFAQADALQRMVQTATGAIDSAGISGSINGEATAAGRFYELRRYHQASQAYIDQFPRIFHHSSGV
jgi:hypothetical protein